MPKYRQKQFDDALAEMLAEAEKAGKPSLRVVARDLHKRIVPDWDHRVAMASWAMWKALNERGGKVIHQTPSGLSFTLEIEFMLKGGALLDEAEKESVGRRAGGTDEVIGTAVLFSELEKLFLELEDKMRWSRIRENVIIGLVTSILAGILVVLLI